MANMIDTLHFNKSTLFCNENSSQSFGKSIGRSAEVRNDYGLRDFFFLYSYSYRTHDYAIYVSCRDNFGTEHRTTMLPDHPDFEYLKSYITEY